MEPNTTGTKPKTYPPQRPRTRAQARKEVGNEAGATTPGDPKATTPETIVAEETANQAVATTDPPTERPEPNLPPEDDRDTEPETEPSESGNSEDYEDESENETTIVEVNPLEAELQRTEQGTARSLEEARSLEQELQEARDRVRREAREAERLLLQEEERLPCPPLDVPEASAQLRDRTAAAFAEAQASARQLLESFHAADVLENIANEGNRDRPVQPEPLQPAPRQRPEGNVRPDRSPPSFPDSDPGSDSDPDPNPNPDPDPNPRAAGMADRDNLGKAVRVRTFSTAKAEDWMTWRRYFATLAEMWRWDRRRAKGELVLAMDGEAARVTSDIDLLGLSLEEALDAYEKRFITTAGAELAETDFLQARQMTDETILAFHARCRELFLRAYPGEPTEGMGLAKSLRRVFVWGLTSQKISVYVWDRRPETYSDCLQKAQEKYSTEQLCKEIKKAGLHAIPGPPGEEKVAFPPKSSGQKGTCHGCGNPGHYIRQCPVILKAKEMGVFQVNKKTDKGKGRGGRKGGSDRGKKKVGAISAPEPTIPSDTAEKDEVSSPPGNEPALSL